LADRQLARLEDITRDLGDTGIRSGVEIARGMAFLAGANPAAAVDHLMLATDLLEEMRNFALPFAAHAAVWAGDPDRLRRVRDRLANAASGTPVMVSETAGADAALAAADGRIDDATAGFVDVLRRWDELEAHFLRAMVALDFVITVGPREPRARAAGEEARAVFERLRAAPLLARLDAALQAEPPAAARVAATAPVHPTAR
jgi:hypothetical protein